MHSGPSWITLGSLSIMPHNRWLRPFTTLPFSFQPCGGDSDPQAQGSVRWQHLGPLLSTCISQVVCQSAWGVRWSEREVDFYIMFASEEGEPLPIGDTTWTLTASSQLVGSSHRSRYLRWTRYSLQTTKYGARATS